MELLVSIDDLSVQQVIETNIIEKINETTIKSKAFKFDTLIVNNKINGKRYDISHKNRDHLTFKQIENGNTLSFNWR